MGKKPKVLIIGGSGYIGSRFISEYAFKYDIVNVDLGWFHMPRYKRVHTIRNDYNTISHATIAEFDVVVLLAAHSSVPMANKSPMLAAYRNNVDNFLELLGKITPSQKFIYASSASVYNGVSGIASETDYTFAPSNLYDLSKHICDQYAERSSVEYYGLRFGTVNGYAPHIRTDIMLNYAFNTIQETGALEVFNGDVKRPILWIDDCIRAIAAIIDTNTDNRGFYNLASFNSTIMGLLSRASRAMDVPLVVLPDRDNHGVPVYDFAVNCEKFKSTFGFEFTGTPEKIMSQLTEMWGSTYRTHRLNGKEYV